MVVRLYDCGEVLRCMILLLRLAKCGRSCSVKCVFQCHWFALKTISKKHRSNNCCSSWSLVTCGMTSSVTTQRRMCAVIGGVVR